MHLPVGPITRSRSKKIKEVLNGLIKRFGVILKRGILSLAQLMIDWPKLLMSVISLAMAWIND
jgi:hypothetical protein